MRKKMSKRSSKRVFRATGSRMKAINVNPPVMRGGIRL